MKQLSYRDIVENMGANTQLRVVISRVKLRERICYSYIMLTFIL